MAIDFRIDEEEDEFEGDDMLFDESVEVIDPEGAFEDHENASIVEETEDGVLIFNTGEDEGGAFDWYDEMSSFDTNLAMFMENSELVALGETLSEDVEADIESRSDWDQKAKDGMEIIGLSDIDWDDTSKEKVLENGSEVVFPTLMEAIVQFNSRSKDEIFPSAGPCKAEVLGQPTEELEDTAERVANYINYQVTIQDEAYMEESDQLLFLLPIYGSMYRRVYFDTDLKRVVARTLTPHDVVIPYTARTFSTAHRWSFKTQTLGVDIQRRQERGEYRDVLLTGGRYDDNDEGVNELSDTIDERSPSVPESDEWFEIIETFAYLEIEDGIGKRPYRVIWDRDSHVVLAVYRNWDADDLEYQPFRDSIEYKYSPGPGCYGLGLFHMIGSLQQAATAILRLIIDAGAMNSISGGFKSKDAKLPGGSNKIAIGRYKDVDCTAAELTAAFYTPPTKTPDASLFNVLGLLENLTRRFSSTTETMTGDANPNAPVGTTVALIEQGTKILSAIHSRVHKSLTAEMRLFYKLNHLYVPEEGYPYQVPGNEYTVFKQDFDGSVQVSPVSDPNVVSKTQRIAQSQATYELAVAHPEHHDMHKVLKRLHRDMGTPDPDEILIDPDNIKQLPAIQENMAMLVGKPVRVFKEQNHEAHIMMHMSFMQNQGFGGNPEVFERLQPIMAQHLMEHLAYLYQQRFEAMGIPGLDPDLYAEQPGAFLKVPGGEMLDDQLTIAATQMIAGFMQTQGLPMPPPPPDPEEEKHQADIRRKNEAHQQKMQHEQEKHQLDMQQDSEKHGQDLAHKEEDKDAEALARMTQGG